MRDNLAVNGVYIVEVMLSIDKLTVDV